MGYVIRTDAFDKPMYFAGSVDLSMGVGIVMTPFIFAAASVAQEDIDDVLSDLGDKWYASEISEVGVSDSLSDA